MDALNLLLPLVLVPLGLMLGLKVAKVDEAGRKWSTVIFDAFISMVLSSFAASVISQVVPMPSLGVLALRVVILLGVLGFILWKRRKMSQQSIAIVVAITFVFLAIAITSSIALSIFMMPA